MTKTQIAAAGLFALVAAAAAAARLGAQQDATQRALVQLECRWSAAAQGRDVAALRLLEAEDFTAIYPDGTTGDKAADIGSVENGTVRFTSFRQGNMRVRVYGATGVVTGRAAITGTAGGQDIAGTYVFTDTWVRSADRWQVVASQVTRVTSTDAAATAVDNQCSPAM